MAGTSYKGSDIKSVDQFIKDKAGGYRPRKPVIEAIRRADLFATLVPDDTYTVASEIHDLLVKTHAADHEKIEMIKELVASNLDVDRILAVATAWVACNPIAAQ